MAIVNKYESTLRAFGRGAAKVPRALLTVLGAVFPAHRDGTIGLELLMGERIFLCGEEHAIDFIERDSHR
ncbi:MULTISPECIES: hypothetical protein [Pseudomonas]|jgi:Na+/H+-dicarboxylate symporter|uniref:hypothetical protein n=1 Tax=Pseudomonas TaxID=286 RepID=UPI00193DA138|nr:hypothetical protein [Pseudomonas arcuscaelestis]MBM3104460.1 hypothetical protein [Pseudomonas arcuscaelestis]MBM3112074.1 hypothetical protein [Pseudomonas arcuscaelestis]